MKFKLNGIGLLYFLAIAMFMLGWQNDYRISLPTLAIFTLLLTNVMDSLSKRLDRLESLESDRDDHLIALEPDPHERMLPIKKDPIGSESSE